MRDNLSSMFIEDCKQRVEALIINKEIQLSFFKKHKITSFLFGGISQKIKEELALLKMQKIACRLAEIGLKIEH